MRLCQDKILDKYCGGAYHTGPLSWGWGDAAAVAKPRDTLSVCLCFMDVSDCARLRSLRLSGPCGSVCEKRLGNHDDGLLPASSRACVIQS